MLGFDKDSITVSGSEGEDLQLSVGISEGYLDMTVSVSFYTMSGTAQGILAWNSANQYNKTTYIHLCYSLADVDYIPASASLLFSGNDSVTLNVTILDNYILDGDRTFFALLLLNDPPANLQPGTINSTLVIIDNGKSSILDLIMFLISI